MCIESRVLKRTRLYLQNKVFSRPFAAHESMRNHLFRETNYIAKQTSARKDKKYE
jgi:hypothetical protein